MSFSTNTLDESYYVPPWSRNLETMVLDKLVLAVEWGHWRPGMYQGNYTCVKAARNELIREHSLSIPLTEYYRKVSEWDTRFHNFNWLINHNGVVYSEIGNKVHAANEVWAEMCSVTLVI